MEYTNQRVVVDVILNSHYVTTENKTSLVAAESAYTPHIQLNIVPMEFWAINMTLNVVEVQYVSNLMIHVLDLVGCKIKAQSYELELDTNNLVQVDDRTIAIRFVIINSTFIAFQGNTFLPAAPYMQLDRKPEYNTSHVGTVVSLGAYRLTFSATMKETHFARMHNTTNGQETYYGTIHFPYIYLLGQHDTYWNTGAGNVVSVVLQENDLVTIVVKDFHSVGESTFVVSMWNPFTNDQTRPLCNYELRNLFELSKATVQLRNEFLVLAFPLIDHTIHYQEEQNTTMVLTSQNGVDNVHPLQMTYVDNTVESKYKYTDLVGGTFSSAFSNGTKTFNAPTATVLSFEAQSSSYFKITLETSDLMLEEHFVVKYNNGTIDDGAVIHLEAHDNGKTILFVSCDNLPFQFEHTGGAFNPLTYPVIGQNPSMSLDSFFWAYNANFLPHALTIRMGIAYGSGTIDFISTLLPSDALVQNGTLVLQDGTVDIREYSTNDSMYCDISISNINATPAWTPGFARWMPKF